jgi:hypothetical protein
VSGKATNRGGDGLELVPQLRGVPFAQPQTVRSAHYHFQPTSHPVGTGGLHEYLGHRSLLRLVGWQKFSHELGILPGGVPLE